MGLLFTIKGAFAETIEGDKVFIDDSNVYLSANPHTLTNADQTIYLELLSKAYTGQINVVFGYNDTNIRPKTFEIKNMGLDVNGSKRITWNNIAPSSSLINYNYQGMTSWRYITGLNVEQGISYEARIQLEQIPSEWGKYWFCVYPTSYGTNLATANANGHLYCLDPWYNITSGISFNQTNLDTNIVVYYSFQENISGTTIPNKVNNISNNATIVGNAFTYANAKYGKGLVTDGVSGFISLFDTNNNLDFGSGEWCINYWENRTSAVDGRGVYTRENTATFVPLMLGYSGAGNATAYASTDGSTWNCLNGVNMGSLSVNNWSMFTSTVIGGRFITYKNGQLISNISYACNLPAKADDARLGQFQGSFTPDRLDEFAVWKGVGCNTSMVSNLWSNGNGYFYTNDTTFQNFSIIAYNNRTNATILGFNATINNMFFNTSNGQITTNLTNTSIRFNISINSSGYYPYIATDYNWTLTPLIFVYLEPIPPTAPNINFPTNSQNVNQFLNISYNQSIALTGSIKYYNITLLNNNGSFNQTIRGNNSLNLSYLWNTFDFNLSPGNYKIKVEATDTNEAKNFSISESFNIITNAYLNITLKNGSTIIPNFTTVLYNKQTGQNTTNITTNNISVFNVIKGYNYTVFTFPNIPFAYDSRNFTTNQSYNNMTFQLVEGNSINITIYDELTASLITETMGLTIRSDVFQNNYSFSGGNTVIYGLQANTYDFIFQNVNYSERIFTTTIINNTIQILNAYLLRVNNSITIGVFVKSSGETPLISNIILQKFINNNWVTVAVRDTDVLGFTLFYVDEGVLYRWIITSDGYGTRSFDLTPYAINSPYTFKLTSTSQTPFIPTLFNISYITNPSSTYVGNEQATQTFSLITSSSEGFVSFTQTFCHFKNIDYFANVSASPNGATADVIVNVLGLTGELICNYTFGSIDGRNTNINKIYQVGNQSSYTGNLNSTMNNMKDDVANFGWSTVLAYFIILVLCILLYELTRNNVVSIVIGFGGLFFFGIIGWIPLSAVIFTILIGGIILYFNR